MNIDNVKPFLKWAGGKTQIIDKLINNFPIHINNYYESFIGGGSVLIELLKNIEKHNIIVDGKIYATDINTSLINCYWQIKNNPKKILNKFKKITDEYRRCLI